jgi:hypothetical protein
VPRGFGRVDFEDDFAIVIEAPDQGIVLLVFDAEVIEDRKGLVKRFSLASER